MKYFFSIIMGITLILVILGTVDLEKIFESKPQPCVDLQTFIREDYKRIRLNGEN